MRGRIGKERGSLWLELREDTGSTKGGQEVRGLNITQRREGE